MSQVEKPEIPEELEVDDQSFQRWLERNFFNANKKERHWKTHLNERYGANQYRNAIMLKRCLREAAAFENVVDKFNAMRYDIGNRLAKAMERNDVSPAVYQGVMDALAQFIDTHARRENHAD